MKILFFVLLGALSSLSIADDNTSQEDSHKTPMELIADGDETGAFELLSEMAVFGDASAQSNLGIMYQRGMSVEVNLKKAFILFQLAAAQKNPYGQFNLAEMYERGDVVERDLDKAMTMYEVVLSNPDADTKVSIASMAAIVRIQNSRSTLNNESQEIDESITEMLYGTKDREDYEKVITTQL